MAVFYNFGILFGKQGHTIIVPRVPIEMRDPVWRLLQTRFDCDLLYNCNAKCLLSGLYSWSCHDLL